MIDEQTLTTEILNVTEDVTFTPDEWRFFVLELNDMVSLDDEINIDNAINNARYLAMLDKSFKQIEKEGFASFTDEEWNNFVKYQDIYLDNTQK